MEDGLCVKVGYRMEGVGLKMVNPQTFAQKLCSDTTRIESVIIPLTTKRRSL